jgi:O-antigen ligase
LLGLIFTLALTGIGAVLGIFRPFYGFLIYVAFSILRPESLWHWSVPPGNYSRIIAISLLTGWVLNGFGDMRLGSAMRAAFWIWAAISAVFCDNHEVALKFLESMAKIILPALAGLTLIGNKRDIVYLAWTITLSMGYVAYDLNMSYFSGFNRLQFAGFGGMDNNSVTIGLVTGVGFAFFLGLEEKSWWRKYIAFASAAFMTHAVFFSFSRGGMLGLCVLGVATVFMIPKTTKNLAFMGLGMAVAGAMAGPQVVERFMSIKDNSILKKDKSEVEGSAESRIELWRICVLMFIESPILGKGPDHFPQLVQNYNTSPSYYKGRFGKGKEGHSLWFQLLAELGLPGVTLLAYFYGYSITKLYQFTRTSTPQQEQLVSLARAVVVSLFGFIVSAQFVSLEGLELPYYVTIVGLGCLKVAAIELPIEAKITPVS